MTILHRGTEFVGLGTEFVKGKSADAALIRVAIGKVRSWYTACKNCRGDKPEASHGWAGPGAWAGVLRTKSFTVAMHPSFAPVLGPEIQGFLANST